MTVGLHLGDGLVESGEASTANSASLASPFRTSRSRAGAWRARRPSPIDVGDRPCSVIKVISST